MKIAKVYYKEMGDAVKITRFENIATESDVERASAYANKEYFNGFPRFYLSDITSREIVIETNKGQYFLCEDETIHRSIFEESMALMRESGARLSALLKEERNAEEKVIEI